MRNSMMISVQLAAVLLVGVCTASCGFKAKPAGAISQPLVGSVEVQVFPVANLTFKDKSGEDIRGEQFEDNQIFFWKEGFTPDEVKQVLAVSQDADKLVDEEFNLTTQQSPLIKECEAKGLNPASFEEELEGVQKTIDFHTGQASKHRRGLEEEEAKPADQQDQKKIDRFKKSLEKALNTIKEIQAKLEARNKEIDKEFEKVGLTSQWEELKSLKVKKEDFLRKTQDVAARLEAAADLTNAPKRVAFYLQNDGSFQGEMEGWDLKDGNGGQTYSTADGSIRSLKYAEYGGTFSWEIVGGELTYRFKMSRYRYKAADGRKYYKGKVLVFNAAGVEVRSGIVKMVDRPAKTTRSE